MSFTITRNGSDISSHVITYLREQKICNGIGVLQVTLDKSYSGSISPYDILVLTENGTKVGTYYVSTINSNFPDYTILVDAQDGTKINDRLFCSGDL